MDLPNQVIGNNVSRTGVCEGNPQKFSCHVTLGKKWSIHVGFQCFFYSFTLHSRAILDLNQRYLASELSHETYSPTNRERINTFWGAIHLSQTWTR
jgi:hypothetical protein